MKYFIDCPNCEDTHLAEYNETVDMFDCTNCGESWSIDVDGPTIMSEEDLALAKSIQQQVKNTEWRI